MPTFKLSDDRPINYNATVGENVVFKCNAYAIPEAKVEWYRNGVEIDRTLTHAVCSSAVSSPPCPCLSLPLSISPSLSRSLSLPHLSLSLSLCLSLCLRFNDHFPSELGLLGTRMSPFRILLELRVMEMLVTTGAMRHAKLQSKRHHQQTNTHFYRPDALPVAQPTVSEM